MSVGISSWMPAVDIPVRLAVRPFTDYWLDEQAKDIQDASKARTMTMSPSAMYILSSIAGRRIVDPIRWVLLDSLQDVLLGKLRTLYPERQDLLASTFGEILGVLLSALTLGGSLSIVRLLEQNQKTPDFLLLGTNPDGNVQAHLVECKGVVEDVHNVNARASKRLDVCKRIRSFRKGGLTQLVQVLPHRLSAGPAIDFDSPPYRRAFGADSTTITLAVVYVPDARIPELIDPGVTFPPERRCADRGADCIQCLKAPGDATRSNVISVLHREPRHPVTLSPPLEAFTSRYQNAQHALWAGDDEYVTEVLNELIRFELSAPGLLSLTTSLVNEALLLQLDIRDLNLSQLRSQATRSGLSRTEDAARRLQSRVRRLKELGRTPVDRMASDTIAAHLASWDEPPRGKALLRSIRTQGTRISGRVEWEDSTAVFRSAIDQSSTRAYEVLRDFNVTLLQQIRDLLPGEFDDAAVEWRAEFANLGRATMQIGASCQFSPQEPTAPQSLRLAAWVSRDGRAEIIVRRLSGNA